MGIEETPTTDTLKCKSDAVRRAYHRKYYPPYRKTNKAKYAESQRRYRASHPWQNIYVGIKSRCNNPKNRKYANYGGRGIKCLLTLQDIEFLWHRDRADLLKSPSIDRIDSDGNYTLENCRFIEFDENRRRKSSHS